jgi:hypothetical protein
MGADRFAIDAVILAGSSDVELIEIQIDNRLEEIDRPGYVGVNRPVRLLPRLTEVRLGP